MKKIILYLFPIIAIVSIFIFININNQSILDINNHEEVALEFKPNKVQCPQCNMFLVEKKYTAQAITMDNKTHFFDDPGCLVLWIEEKYKGSDKDIVKWVYTLDTKHWIDAQKAFYSFNDRTPMNYGFGAYEKRVDSHISYDEMRLRMLRGENMRNPKIRKKILGY
ncbi:MAG TPA: hypothetical protein EYG83_09615 [Sulfurospirillum arcachonense]|nr:hypothetical protein [Sulfurospirillum arcachonense]